MANKHKKKRNKVYSGADAAITRPVVTKISAVNRNKLQQWWFDHKRIARPVIIAVAIAAGVIILVIEIVRIATNG
ncbi:hypothetical protein H7100_03830 [Candidatus Saccharibacteria bacterium]|nr:hypothetical protein [Candidatus Saccharibacteria bacterium]